jgi:hypothetical protein
VLHGVVLVRMNMFVRLAGRRCGAVVEEKRRASGANNRSKTAKGRGSRKGGKTRT